MLNKYMIFNHQGKADKYEEILNLQYEKVSKPPVDIVFSDQAIYGRVEKLRRLHAKQYFIYPHSARPSITSDIEPQWERITAEFVTTECHAEVMRSYGYKHPIHSVGWHLCDFKPFEPKKVKNVLFAPIHPRNHAIDKISNQMAFEKLRNLDINLVVRYISSLGESGLERVEQDNIVYHEGTLTPSVDQIDDADVVVAYETFAYLAVARGVPTVTFGEDVPTHLIPRGRPLQLPKNWNKYKHLLRYPIDIMDGDAMEMLERAAESDEEIRGWRYRMIGEKLFDPDKFLSIVGSYEKR